jgi:ribosomal protein S18 acetylase RimI-like enzyme
MAEVSDATEIAHVRVAAWRAAYRGLMPDAYLDRADLKDIEAELMRHRLSVRGDEAHMSVAEWDGRVVGYCAYGSGGNDDTEASGGVYDLYIHPDAWRRGVGRQLLVYAIEHFKQQGFSEATLFVIEGNTRARNFYEQVGWRADGYRRTYEYTDFSLPILRYRTICS